MRKRTRKKITNTFLITSIIGAVLAFILIVTGIYIWSHKPRPAGPEKAFERITVTKPIIVDKELLIKGCLFDLGIPKEHVRITGNTVDVTLSKGLEEPRIHKAFVALEAAPGVEVSIKGSSKVKLIMDGEEWAILFHVLKGPSKRLDRVAIIIDDMGIDMDIARKLCAIDADLTFSVLPHEKYTEEVAQYLHEHGKEVLLHLPMEGNGKNPGAGAIYNDTEPSQAATILKDSLERVKPADGVNNHMGSVVTQNEAIMKALFSIIKERGLFFIDSLTTANSVCHLAASEAHIRFAARDVFLDNDQTYSYISGQLNELITVAQLRHRAIGICHPHPATAEVLARELKKMQDKGIEVVRVSTLVERDGQGLP